MSGLLKNWIDESDENARLLAQADLILDASERILEAMERKLRELEKRKRALVHEKAAAVPTIVTGGVEQWAEIAASLAQIGDKMTPDELETAREIVHGYIGEVSVVEEGEGVFGYVRLAKPPAGYKAGAQDALPDLYLERIPLRLK